MDCKIGLSVQMFLPILRRISCEDLLPYPDVILERRGRSKETSRKREREEEAREGEGGGGLQHLHYHKSLPRRPRSEEEGAAAKDVLPNPTVGTTGRKRESRKMGRREGGGGEEHKKASSLLLSLHPIPV